MRTKKMFPFLLILFSSLFGIWQKQESGTSKDLFGIYFIDSSYGWVCGDSGIILFTSNGGREWICQRTPVNKRLKAIHFIDLNRGWACGESGIILPTTNGGIDWEIQSSPVNETLQDITFDPVSHLYGWGGGNKCGIWSFDGGNSWQGDSTIRDFNAVYSFDEFCVVFGNNFCLFTTTDLGRTWYYTPSQETILDLKVYLQVGPDIWTAGRNGKAEWGDRGGEFFWDLYPAVVPGTCNLFGIAYEPDFSEIWIVGDDGSIFYSRDTGRIYYLDTILGIPLYDVTFPCVDLGWAVGKYGAIFHYTNEANINEKGLLKVFSNLKGTTFDIRGNKVLPKRKGVYFLKSNNKFKKIIKWR
ncbi:MAG: YCF48-related protein [candidate division WOR-3 bacterium]